MDPKQTVYRLMVLHRERILRDIRSEASLSIHSNRDVREEALKRLKTNKQELEEIETAINWLGGVS